MTADELAIVGRALFGDRWQSELARALCVTDRTVRRWFSGAVPVPDTQAIALRALVKRRAAELRKIAAKY